MASDAFDMNDDHHVYDVAIVGAGVVGAAIARELSRYELSCALIEGGGDVGAGTSKANTAIWHTGFDAKPGTLESRLLRRSYALLENYLDDAGIAVERLGALLVAWNDEQLAALPGILDRAQQNGVTDVRRVPAEEVYAREPNLNAGALGGVLVPGESIFCPFSLPLALATQAVQNGVALKLDHPVAEVCVVANTISHAPSFLPAQERGERDAGVVQPWMYQLRGSGGLVRCRYLVNVAGLYADAIDRLLGHADFTVTPRRGELIVFDKLARGLVNHILLPVPTSITKGVLISPTVYGNVMLGPTAEDLDDKTDTATSARGLELLWRKGQALMPRLLEEEVTATYAGLRAATEHADYQIRPHAGQRYVCVGGIRSTGASASLGIAEYVVELLAEAGLALHPKAEFQPVRMPYLGETSVRAYQSAERIATNPDYGRIVCHCERVTLGELIDATHAAIPARTLDGLRRRTRVLQGRCQGFNCHANVAAILARETGQSVGQVIGLS
jgi:glycerol-3-phosphate dehydrogenase